MLGSSLPPFSGMWERENDHVCAGTSMHAGLRTPSAIIPQASSTLCFWGRVSHGPAASLVSLLAGSELQGSTWLFLQKTGVTNRHHHSQIVQHGSWGPSSDKVSTFPARLLPSLLSVHLYMCVHRGVHTLESSSAEPGRVSDHADPHVAGMWVALFHSKLGATEESAEWTPMLSHFPWKMTSDKRWQSLQWKDSTS